MQKNKVLVGMSGGIDSSYTAALLQQQGYEVTGLMLRLWSEPSVSGENNCCSTESQFTARRAAAKLDIPFYIHDAKEEFFSTVVTNFIEEYSRGNTPNPCVLCNSRIRWKLLRKKASDFGLDYIATGHYAIIEPNDEGNINLKKGKDRSKDQSYALAMISRNDLINTLLPLGKMRKTEVRENSKKLQLPNSDKPDSQDLCFLGNTSYHDLLSMYASDKFASGAIKDTNGKVVGIHSGLPFYTIGQRKGLRIANTVPYYVVAKDFQENTLIVSTERNSINTQFRVKNINWFINIQGGSPLECTVQTRYRSEELAVLVNPIDESCAEVSSQVPMKASITPGQVAVFYQGDRCLGGGIIV